MMSFAKKNPVAFNGQRFELPMLFASMKMFGGVFCLTANMLIMIRSENIEDVVKDFIAVQIISQIDDMISRTIDHGLKVGTEGIQVYISNT